MTRVYIGKLGEQIEGKGSDICGTKLVSLTPTLEKGRKRSWGTTLTARN